MNTYYASIVHDYGIVSLIIHAHTKELAIKAICDIEGCPEWAITEIISG